MNRQQRRQAARAEKRTRKPRRDPGHTGIPDAGIQGVEREFQRASQRHQMGDLRAAAEGYRRVLELHPRHAEACHALGAIVHRHGNSDEAARLIRRALAVRPDEPEWHYNLGVALAAREDLAAAESSYLRAIELQPDYKLAVLNLATVLQTQGRHDEAQASYLRAIEIDPNCAAAYYDLGSLYQAQGEFEAAQAAYSKVLEVQPDHCEAHLNLAALFRSQGRIEDATAAARRALASARRQPGSRSEFKAHYNLGICLTGLGRFEDSLTSLGSALEIDPDCPIARFSRAYPLLGLGRLKAGWQDYEQRVHRPECRRLPVPYPEWDGGPLDGKTILVRAEQGVGDEVLFGSCLPDLIARAGHCVIECEPRLESLYKRSFPEACVYGVPRQDSSWLDDAPPVDCHVMLAGLMRHLRPDIDSFPRGRPFLQSDDVARDRFARRLEALGPGPKVGISWRSMKDRNGYIYPHLDLWEDILRTPGVTFVNLQYDAPEPEIAEAEARFGVAIHSLEGLDLRDDFDGVAALVAALDLVIAPDNTTWAIAAGVGAPAWVLHVAAWWMLGRERNPWLDAARSYLCDPDTLDWAPALACVAADLRRLAASGEPGRRLGADAA